MTTQKEKMSRKLGKLLAYPFKMIELLLLVALLIFSLVLVRGWATEPATGGRSLFQSPPIGPTSTPTPGVFLVKQTPTPRPTPVLNLTFTNEPFYLSLANSGAYTVGSVANVSDEDILRFDGTDFSLFFDGSDVGVGSVDLNAFILFDSDTILMSFDNPVTISGLGSVDDSDIVQFDATSLGDTTAGTFSWFFDGSDVGLTADSEDIDGLDFLPNGQLLISAIGSASVTGVSGQDEDILILTPTSLGENTAGSWAMYFDGSDVGLANTSDEDVDGLAISTSGSIYLTTVGNFSVTGISGADEDVFVCIPDSLGSDTACTFSSALSFDGSVWGLSGNDVDAIDPLP
jgi:hypothetical protein